MLFIKNQLFIFLCHMGQLLDIDLADHRILLEQHQKLAQIGSIYRQ